MQNKYEVYKNPFLNIFVKGIYGGFGIIVDLLHFFESFVFRVFPGLSENFPEC